MKSCIDCCQFEFNAAWKEMADVTLWHKELRCQCCLDKWEMSLEDTEEDFRIYLSKAAGCPNFEKEVG